MTVALVLLSRNDLAVVGTGSPLVTGVLFSALGVIGLQNVEVVGTEASSSVGRILTEMGAIVPTSFAELFKAPQAFIRSVLAIKLPVAK